MLTRLAPSFPLLPHLDALAAVFDASKAVIKTPLFFASNISEIARPIAIDGSQVMIARGDHREAIFWIVATYSRCQKVLHDAPIVLQAQFQPGYRKLLGVLASHQRPIFSSAARRSRRSCCACGKWRKPF